MAYLDGISDEVRRGENLPGPGDDYARDLYARDLVHNVRSPRN